MTESIFYIDSYKVYKVIRIINIRISFESYTTTSFINYILIFSTLKF